MCTDRYIYVTVHSYDPVNVQVRESQFSFSPFFFCFVFYLFIFFYSMEHVWDLVNMWQVFFLSIFFFVLYFVDILF